MHRPCRHSSPNRTGDPSGSWLACPIEPFNKAITLRVVGRGPRFLNPEDVTGAGCLCGKADMCDMCDGSAHSSGCVVNGYGFFVYNCIIFSASTPTIFRSPRTQKNVRVMFHITVCHTRTPGAGYVADSAVLE